MLDKGVKLADYILTNLRNAVLNKVDQLSSEYFSYMKDLIDNSLQVPRNQKNCSLVCCRKKNVKYTLSTSVNFKPLVSEFKKCQMGFKKNMFTNLSSDDKTENYFLLTKLSLQIEDMLNNKVNFLFEVSQMNEKLKDEVDRYWEYFNIRKILSKQSNKIKAQKVKLNALEDSRMQNECIICMENERNVIFYPCLHLICCEICAFGKLGNDCPECQGKIENKQLTLS